MAVTARPFISMIGIQLARQTFRLSVLFIHSLRSAFLAFSISALASAGEKERSCDEFTVHVQGNSLAPLVKSGARLKVAPIGCGDVDIGDIVAFKTSALPDSTVVKRVVADGGKHLKLERNGTGGVRVFVDGEPALAVDGKPYELSDRAASVLKLYEGSLPPNTLLVLGRPGTLDSAKIGLVPLSDVVGVVVLPETQSDLVTRP